MSEEIVISGISGRFPESASFAEFQANLFAHVDMVTVNERRFKPGLYGIPAGFGTLKEITKFDAEFFKILPGQAQRMDPQLRLAMETSYEAIVDGGINPAAERGSRTGVFYAVCTMEANNLWNLQPNRVQGVSMTGTAQSMFANRISYAFNFKGPSGAYDTACSSSIYALEAAVAAMQAGKCEAALVVASTLILSPHTSLQFDKLGMLSKDSRCKSFDKSGDGFARAETVATLYLQRASVARRAYATIVHVKTNTDGYKDGGVTYPSARMQRALMAESYVEAGVNPDHVAYIEAHGTGTAVGDPQEVLAISKVFKTTKRSHARPLLIGSVKSNMGHSEGASGLCGIAKLITILQTGMIPANLHYKEPNFKLKPIRSGRLRVVDENMPWEGGLMALNSFGFGGVNTHLILKPYGDPGDCGNPVDRGGNPDFRPSPRARLVLCSGRTEDGVREALKEVARLQDRHPHMVILLNEINRTASPGLNVRGYSVLGKDQGKDNGGDNGSGQVEISSDHTAGNGHGNIWFVFNGMGSQWVGMGRDLLQIPAYRASVEKSAFLLQQHANFDLMRLLDTQDESTFNSPTNVFVSIAAIQIALVDTVRALGIKPSGVVGHSAGEVLCAYADECLTAEQIILAAYWRGATLEPKTKSKGTNNEKHEMAMAAVGLSWNEAKAMAPEGVYAACNNGLESVTMSGPKHKLQELVAAVKAQGKPATVVSSCGIAFHSPYVAAASEELRTALREVIPEPLARSPSWVSSSIPESEWGSPLAATLSPDYIVNNFLSPVLFYDAVRKIPAGSVIVEVGPSGLLRGLIKRAAPPSCTVIPLQSRGSKDGVADFATALGKLFLTGAATFDANLLMDTAPKFPVPVSTPSLSSLVAAGWDHGPNSTWDVPTYGQNGEFNEGAFEIDMSDPSHAYLAGHAIQGRVLFPATGYIVLVWRHFAQMHMAPSWEAFPVVFENVRFSRVTVLRQNTKVEFRVHISEGSGAFEVMEDADGTVICTGTVRKPNGELPEERMKDLDFQALEAVEGAKLEAMQRPVTGDHIYKSLRFLGYEYMGLFRGIQRSDQAGSAFLVSWRGNWIAFLDTVLQTTLRCFTGEQTATELPTGVRKLVLDPEKLLGFVANNTANLDVSIFTKYNTATGLVKCRGIEAEGVSSTAVASVHHREPPPTLSTHTFTTYFDSSTESSRLGPVLQCLTVVIENMASRRTFAVPTILELSTCEESVDGVDDDGLEGASDANENGGADETKDATDSHSESIQISDLLRGFFSILEIDYTLVSKRPVNQEVVDKLSRHRIKYVQKEHESLFTEPDWVDRKFDLIILDKTEHLSSALRLMKPGSFLILKVNPEESSTEEDSCQKLGNGHKIHLVAKKNSHEVHASHPVRVFLMRKDSEQNTKAICTLPVSSSSSDLSWVPKLGDLLRKHQEVEEAGAGVRPPLIYLTSNDDSPSGLLGLVLSVRKEPNGGQARSILVKGGEGARGTMALDFVNPSPILSKILAHDLAINVIDEEGRWGFYIHEPIDQAFKIQTDKAFVGMEVIGDLTTLGWVQGPDYKKLCNANARVQQCVPVDVHYAALNFKDVMLATGNLQPDRTLSPYFIESPLGFEFSGMAPNGRRVMGYNQGQALASHVLAEPDSLWTIPESWSFADAATVPVVYATVYFALVMRGQMRAGAGESILIHAGAGGVGQAAIRVALSLGCTVFTTVGSPEKRDFIRAEFPAIPESHIRSTRNTEFETMVMEETRGRGVDVVLNSLTGDKLEASVRCLARHGRFLEIGKVDLVANKAMGMSLLLRDASIHGVMLDALWDAKLGTRAELKTFVQNGIDSGVVRPLPRRVYNPRTSPGDIEAAFRFMGQGRHIGKILIQIRDDEVDEGMHRLTLPLQLPASPRVYFDPDKSYIVVGGLGGFGLEFVNWMTSRYAAKIVLTSRSGITDAYQEAYLSRWAKTGVDIKILKLDASKMADAATLLDKALAMGPLGGFFNLAMVLRIGLMATLTEEDFRTVLEPKVNLTLNMDAVIRKYTRDRPAHARTLDHFVVFSSAVSGFGIDGQANYAMANSAIERICEQRAAEGLPGKAIQWGPIGEVGGWHEAYNKDFQRVSFHGSGVQSIHSALRSLDVLMTHRAPVMLSRRTIDLDMEGGGACGGGQGGHGHLSVVERIARILGHANLARVNPACKLTELGMDSVMAMEVRQVLEQDFGLSLAATEIRSCTLEQLTDMSKNTGKSNVNH